MSVSVTAGSGTVIAADVIGTPSAPSAGQVEPYNKLDGGIAGSSAPIEAGNAAALEKQITTVLRGKVAAGFEGNDLSLVRDGTRLVYTAP